MDRYGRHLPELKDDTNFYHQSIRFFELKTLCFFPPDVFVFPNGHRSGLQQPVHEPARPARPPRRDESCQHGIGHEQPQYERASHGHEPGPDPGHGAFWGSRPKNASAGVSWRPSTRHAHTGDEKAVSRRGEWNDVMVQTN